MAAETAHAAEAAAHGFDLLPIVILLAAAVVAVPLFKRLGLGSVLGYLAAGLAIYLVVTAFLKLRGEAGPQIEVEASASI